MSNMRPGPLSLGILVGIPLEKKNPTPRTCSGCFPKAGKVSQPPSRPPEEVFLSLDIRCESGPCHRHPFPLQPLGCNG